MLDDDTVRDLLTPREAADVLRLSTITLQKQRAAGTGPAFIKMGAGRRARIRYARADLDAYVAQCRRGGQVATGAAR